MISVFIGYGGTEGKKIGNKLRDFLNQNGIEPFIAPRDVPPGATELQFIVRKILDSDAAVLIITEDYSSSVRFEKEVNYISRKNIPIVPFKEENAEIPLIIDFMDLQYLSFNADSPEDKFEEIKDAVEYQVDLDEQYIEKAKLEAEA